MGTSPRRPHTPPHRKEIDERTIIDQQGTSRIALSYRLDKEPFPNDAGSLLTVELVTEENGYQYLELHPQPEDLDGEPAHQRHLPDR